MCFRKPCVFNHQNVKLFLSGILAVVSCLSLHAEEETTQPEMYSNGSSCIYIVANTKIYGKEHLLADRDTPQDVAKNTTKVRRKTAAPVQNETVKKADDNVEKKEPAAIVFPDFPFMPSSPSYLSIENRSAAATTQQKLSGQYPASRANRVSLYPDAGISDLSLPLPEQRQKLSAAATQCGILTSFSPNSPALF